MSARLEEALHHLRMAGSLLEKTQDTHSDVPPPVADGSAETILKTSQDALRAAPQAPRNVIRSLHHFACSGGTLIANLLGAQPNVRLLSEVNPFSTQLDARQLFRPSDIAFLARRSSRPIRQDTLEALFVAEIQVLARASFLEGFHLVLRDHTHSAYCLGAGRQKGPPLRQILLRHFETRGLVTVRHPLDCYLSLRTNKWLHFRPTTLNEYALRMQHFLKEHSDLPMLRYEDLLANPSAVISEAAKALDLAYDPDAVHISRAFALSGNSGRRSDQVSKRGRRAVPKDLHIQAKESEAYHALCETLRYDPDPAAPPTTL